MDIYSIIPPLLALILVILTRRVLLSLGVSIIVGALMLYDFSVPKAGVELLHILSSLFFSYDVAEPVTVGGIFSGIADSGFAINDWEFFILLFLIFLGMVASFISFSGGSTAFGEWAVKRIKTRRGAQLLPIVLGFIIFIDDYFNSLTVGNVSRPVTDRHRISRAKLAYYVDSTAAPICVIAPLSSWGAYIITFIAEIFENNQVTEYGAFQAFLMMIPMNLYAITALSMVFIVALYKFDFGLMKKHEDLAVREGVLYDLEKGEPEGSAETGAGEQKGKISYLIAPILALVVVTVGLMISTGISGAQADGVAVTTMSILEYTDIARALLYGSIVGMLTALICTVLTKPVAKDVWTVSLAGVKSMMPAVLILILAWTISSIIGDLGTGAYLASLVEGGIPPYLLPVMLFVIAGISAVSTGTSWGTFAILLPIAGDMGANVDSTLLLPMLAAVLAGSIFGDHVSPISDTTILSAAGSGSHHIDHVMTQLPYALLAAAAALVGYIVLPFAGTIVAVIVSIALLLIAAWIIKRLQARKTSE
ncbi:Na+/H+ antiporter NhaC family protein [Alkalicoccobacillus porphyridii]|uniref:Na+/H+ antiporter NhaC family protein n=1 Tax=Alkalicoccobacillus porphyridii TaxID=2597270 RepID=A0A554A3F5_9BACI|nr:Na+/H+ antiporter NhaC family protein [Alkalicoccobacillus porphyridii]TSB48223.1 Na+/H+ antiporter NhaC family protein [Alkalicoccobacillus porphyridii]